MLPWPTKISKEHDLIHGCYTLCPTCALLFNVIKATLQSFNKTGGSANLGILLKTMHTCTSLEATSDPFIYVNSVAFN